MEHTEDVVVVSTTIPHASTIVSDASPEKAEAVLKIPTASGSSATTTPMATVSTTPVVEKHFQRRIFKIIVIGDSNVGKTCLTYRFCSGKFPTKVEATIGVDFREKIVEVDGETIKLQLWDTAGQERFRKSMVPHYYRNAHAVVFVYDVTKPESFASLPAWISESELHGLGAAGVPRLLVGNKCDALPAAAEAGRGGVPLGIAQRFSDAHCMPLFETSAKDDAKLDHVEAIFLTLAHKLKNAKPLMSPVGYVVGRGDVIHRSPPQQGKCSC